MTTLAIGVLLLWLYLVFARGRFWQAGPVLPVATPQATPPVAIIVPARDEAEVIEASLRSLLAQDYPGPFRVILTDDNSTDGTGRIARAIADPRLTVIEGTPRPPGWSGKLWAVAQGMAAVGVAANGLAAAGVAAEWVATGEAAELLLLTDADVVHEPAHLSSLVARIERDGLDLVSEMVGLHCESLAERALVPAFVFFFQMLYPFAWVNDRRRAVAAAAGGTVLVRRLALQRINGIDSIKAALIDDVALAAAVKSPAVKSPAVKSPAGKSRAGESAGAIWLGHSVLARSVRRYPGLTDVWQMITRTAFVQLRHSMLLLTATTAGMAVTWLLPPVLAVFGHGAVFWCGLASWLLLAACYLPTLHRFRRSAFWAPFLPLVAAFYMAATLGSAANHYRGRGVAWKGRAYQ